VLLTRTKPRVPAVNRLEGRALGVMAARNRQDQGIVALEFAEPARCARDRATDSQEKRFRVRGRGV
jgi:hypothetical protein